MKNGKKICLSQNHFAEWLESPEKMAEWQKHKKRKLTEEEKRLCDFGHEIHSKAKLLYPEGIEPCDNRNFDSRLKQSEALLKAGIPLFEPLFAFDNLSVQVDILNPLEDGSLELLEVKSAKNISEEWIKYTAFQYYVCQKADIKISKVSMMHLKGYIDLQNTPLDEIFDKTDITDKVIELQGEIESIIIAIINTIIAKRRVADE